MTQIPFFKMSGCGNDFIVIDHRKKIIRESMLSGLITGVCRRKLSVGADGLILIEKSERHDFRWRFFNSDGSRAEMCGNGARCAARFAYMNGIAEKELTFETDVGVVTAQVIGERVKVNMPAPSDLTLDVPVELEGGTVRVNSVHTGVPHVVLIVEQLDAIDVVKLGREIRYHRDFTPAGTNVNFICPEKENSIAIRTYERGVEDETLACGTGAIAGAMVAGRRLRMASPVAVKTRSGGYLTISFSDTNNRFGDIRMEGDARIIYTGTLWSEAWQ